ncbi:Heparin-sulfate lyase N-terminal domain-containing protein [uncultured Gammaproteobacteria bacterium]
MTWLKDGLRQILFGNPIYNLTLAGRPPTELSAVPLDPWPGDEATATAMLGGAFTFSGQTIRLDETPYAEKFWVPDGASPQWLRSLHGFDWLHDLRALNGDDARRLARNLIFAWIDTFAVWNADTWSPELLGIRIANWIALHDFYCASAEEGFRVCVFDSLGRQTRHLSRVMPGTLHGESLILAIKGLVLGSLAVPEGLRYRTKASRLLEQALPHLLLADGTHVSRCPSTHLRILRHLLDMRTVWLAVKTRVPDALQQTIERMTPVVRFFRHGDGGLAVFNGGQEEVRTLVSTILVQADTRSRPVKSLMQAGFERLALGRTVILVDSGLPSPPGEDAQAHAGTLSMEFSVGRERLIVNCGAHPTEKGAWRGALAATAAHSVLTVAETNSSEVREAGGLGRRPGQIRRDRRDTETSVGIDVTHDGYERGFGLIYRRRLVLSDGGESLHGEDILEPPPGQAGTVRPWVLRFHLHPDVQTHRLEDGSAVLLQPSSGSQWWLSCEDRQFELGESVYLGDRGQIRPSSVVMISGETNTRGATILWTLRREGDPVTG